jgi:exodeoxyribonuclease V gamma subunit
VNHAAIHWGLDAAHKQKILTGKEETATDYNSKFTWHQGLERLLLGFAYGDQDVLYQEQLLLADVEGDEALLLGRYFELLEQLQNCARELQMPRRPNEWKQFLLQTKDSLFSSLPVDVNAQQIIEQAIDDLGEYTCHAHYNKPVPLSVVRDFLSNHFSQPEPGRQFMAGQVTFCSMVPMRSVPFRIIAVLGLNDGEFPRQRQPMGFDLMAMEPARKGDRSRRGDDRYLFLEALISCRDKLYLSYQGHDIKTNNTREPSLVLQELMDYLEKGYGWKLSSEPSEQLFNVPLQAFSKENYHSSYSGFHSGFQRQWQSFNASWLKLSEAGELRDNLKTISELPSSETINLSAEQLVQFFDNPAKSFAKNRLGLYLERNDAMIPDDSEPFVTDHLDRYLIQDAIIKTALSEETDEQKMNDLISGFCFSGALPDTPNTSDDLKIWQEQAIDFAKTVQSEIQSDKQAQGDNEIITKSVSVIIDDVQLQADLPLRGNRLIYWRLASPKGKDDIRLWIHHLIAQITLDNITTFGIFRGDKKTDNEQSILTIHFEPDSADWAKEQLSELIQIWKEGMQQPLLLNATLGQKHLSSKPLNDYTFAAFWNDDFQTQGLGSDPYMHWFWGDNAEEPQWENKWQARIEKIYAPLYAKRKVNV